MNRIVTIVSRTLRYDLVILNLLVWLLILFTGVVPNTIGRIIFGLPFMLFIPGYTLIAALHPDPDRLDWTARLTLSVVSSFVTVSLLVLVVNFTRWQLTLMPIVWTVSIFVLVTSLLAWWRRRRRRVGDHFRLKFGVGFMLSPGNRGNLILKMALLYVVIGSLVFMGYSLINFRQVETFSEFYVLDKFGEAHNYTVNLTPGQGTDVILGITNREGASGVYKVTVADNGTLLQEIGPVVLPADETWEKEVSLVPTETGTRQVTFQLYLGDDPYLKPLYLWVDTPVRE